MNKGHWTLLGLAILLLASGSLLLRREAPATIDPLESGGAQAPEQPADPVATGTEGGPLREIAHTQEAASKPAPQPSDAPRPGTMLKVLVREKQSRAPVAGATVRFVPTDTSHLSVADFAVHRDLRPDWERVAARFGTSAVTDSQGIAWVPADLPRHPDERQRSASGWVTARADERYADLNVNPSQNGGDEATLLLERDVSAVVKVVDPKGIPQPGVAVGLFAETDQTRRGFPRWQGRAQAPDASVRIAHVQQLSPQAKQPWTLRAISPALHSTSLPFDVRSPPTETVVLTVQPSGSLAVTVRGGVESGDFVRLRIVGDKNPTQYQNTERLDPETGRARFERLGLGVNFLVTAERNGIAVASRELAGPRAADEATECVIDLETECGSLVARLLDAEGQALARSAWRAELADKRSRMFRQRLVADDDGRVRVVIPSELAKAALTWIRFAKDEQDRVLVAKAPTPLTVTPGELNLGDLRCIESPLLVAGTLLDEGGKPVQGGDLGLTQAPDKGMREFRNEWYSLLTPPRADVTTLRRPDGSFAIHGSGLPGQTKVLVRHEKYVPLPALSFREGQRDLAIVLRRGADVRAEVLCADSSIPDQIQVALSGGQGSKAGDLHAVRASRGDDPTRGRYAWNRVPGGTYQLTIKASQTGELLATLRDVVVPDADTATDPRLREIDLRGLAQNYALNIVDANGAKVRSWGNLSYPTPEGARSVWFSEGHASFVSAQRGLEVTLRGDGLRKQRIRLEPGENRVTRLAGLKVSVTCPDLAGLGEQSVGAMLEVDRSEWARGNRAAETVQPWQQELPQANASASIQKDGTCSFSLPEAGTYRFVIYGITHFGEGGPELYLRDFSPATIEVKDVAEAQSFRFDASAGGKQAIADWLAKRGK